MCLLNHKTTCSPSPTYTVIPVALVHGPSDTVDTGFHGLGTLRDEHGKVVSKKGVLQQGKWKDDKLVESRPVV